LPIPSPPTSSRRCENRSFAESSGEAARPRPSESRSKKDRPRRKTPSKPPLNAPRRRKLAFASFFFLQRPSSRNPSSSSKLPILSRNRTFRRERVIARRAALLFYSKNRVERKGAARIFKPLLIPPRKNVTIETVYRDYPD
jgi:hypothetical protein